MSASSPRTALAEGPMSRFQWSVVAVCVLLNMLDGFDVLVMAFTADSVAAEWSLSGTQIGLLLSASLFGMAVGSMLVAPWADRFGRRPITLGCLTLAGVTMLLSAVSQSTVQLGILRVLTGIGIGGILASSNVIAAEYASDRWRGLAVSLNSTGYAIGATVGGVAAGVLIGDYGWRSVFLFGGLATVLLIPLVWFRMPESLDFLLTRRPAGALQRVNALAARIGTVTLERMPDPLEPSTGVAGGYRELLSRESRRNTLVLWVAFFGVMAGFYFVTSWTPTLLIEAGLSQQQGITGGTLLNVGGIAGAALLGLLAARFALRKVLIAYLISTAVLLAALTLATSQLVLAYVLCVAIGLFVNGCVAGHYALTPSIYRPAVRTTGMGTALAVGRAGAILAPSMAGVLLDIGWGPQQLYLAAGVILIGTGAALTLLRVRTRTAEPEAEPTFVTESAQN